MKKKIYFLFALVVSCFFTANSQKPVAEFYPDGYPGWADNIKWSNVIKVIKK